MMKFVLIAVLFLQASNSQPAKQETQREQQQAYAQVSPAPTDNRQIETGNKANATPDDRNSISNSFQETQIYQYWVLVGTSIITALVLVVYTIFAGLQWWWIKKQANSTGDQVLKLQDQLELVKKQSRTMLGTWKVIRDQREVMERGLGETGKTVEAMQGQLEAMKLQEGHMQAQSEAMSSQLEIMKNALKANRDSVDLAWEGLKIQKRAYLGTNRMNIDLTARKRLAIYLTNVGKSPATSVIAKLQVTISTPVDWHERQPENVRILALGEEEYRFNLTGIYPDSIPVRIGFPLGKHFSDEELTLVVQKKSRLTVNLTLEYHDGFDNGFSYFVLTYRGKDSHGHDSWGIFPTESEKEYDQANPDS